MGRCAQADSVFVVKKEEIRCHVGTGDICNLVVVQQA
jgi:hypothetical protein